MPICPSSSVRSETSSPAALAQRLMSHSVKRGFLVSTGPRQWVKITLPVDLRRLYGSKTLRNFSLVLNIGVDPRFGDYSLEELCNTIYHQLRAYATPQHMAGMIAANVQPQQLIILRLAPVFLKNIVMNAVYRRTGESFGCLSAAIRTTVRSLASAAEPTST